MLLQTRKQPPPAAAKERNIFGVAESFGDSAGTPNFIFFTAAEAVKKKNKIWSACGAPNGFKYSRMAMRIPNMCLVLKLDNEKVISIADEQNHRQTDRRTKPPSTVLLYRH